MNQINKSESIPIKNQYWKSIKKYSKKEKANYHKNRKNQEILDLIKEAKKITGLSYRKQIDSYLVKNQISDLAKLEILKLSDSYLIKLTSRYHDELAKIESWKSELV